MRRRATAVACIALAVLLSGACATKKYVRNRVNERATPISLNRAPPHRRACAPDERLRRDLISAIIRTNHGATPPLVFIQKQP